MRILILADPLDNQQAGIHYYTRNLLAHLAKIDTNAEYYILRRKKDDIFPADRQIIIKNYRFPAYAALRMFCIIPRKIKKLKADIVVEPAHFGPFNLPEKIKRVTVMHDLTPILYPELHRYHSQLLQRVFLKKILKKAALIITNSDNTSRDVVTYCPSAKQKTKRIYLGSDDSIRYTGDRAVPEKYTKGKPYFLFTGTIEPRKNLTELLKAFDIFKSSSGLPHLLLIAGQKGWKSRAFFNKLERHPFHDDIRLCGFVDRKDMPGLYSHARAFIFPSLYEGFGLPVVEAMSCGTPCLLSDTSSLPEVGGDAALYFNPLAAQEISDSMIRIVSDEKLHGDLSGKALKQAEKFSWDDHCKLFDLEIRKLLKT